MDTFYNPSYLTQRLKDFFRSAGEVTYSAVGKGGQGIVDFADGPGLEAASNKPDLDLDGKRLKVKEERGRNSRSRSVEAAMLSEEARRTKGLGTAIDATNKGFTMLHGMGFKKGR